MIVLDIAMPVLNGLDAGRQLKEMFPAIKLVYLTMNPDSDVAAEAFRRGASGYLLKTCAAAEMVSAVRSVLRGKTFLSTSLSRDAIDCLLWQGQGLVSEEKRLTDRQREVLQLLAEGKVMKEVGGILHMTTRTVGLSQVPDHGSAWRQKQCGTCQVRSQKPHGGRLVRFSNARSGAPGQPYARGRVRMR